MKERPILFSGPMVCAILDGRKTQTRRIVPIDDASRITLEVTDVRVKRLVEYAKASKGQTQRGIPTNATNVAIV